MNSRKLRRRLILWLSLLVVGEFAVMFTLNFRANRETCETPVLRNLYFSGLEAARCLTFHSQFGQDRWVVQQIFPDVRDGYFVDVGSSDGSYLSNTKVLEDRGWTGICIDPFPTNMETRRCTVSKSVVYSVAGQKVNFINPGQLVGGIEDHLGRGEKEAEYGERVEFVTTTLTEVLKQANSPPYIHYMSLDIEGAELAALKGLDFSTYRIGAFTIEHNFEEPKRSQIRALLESHGYRYVRAIVVEDCFVLADGQAPTGKTTPAPRP